jgi:hypothetical protein
MVRRKFGTAYLIKKAVEEMEVKKNAIKYDTEKQIVEKRERIPRPVRKEKFKVNPSDTYEEDLIASLFANDKVEDDKEEEEVEKEEVHHRSGL